MDITIKDDGIYDIKEVNELTKIPIRNLQRIALRRNIEKAGRSYIFTGAQIKDLWLNTVSPPKDTAIPPSEEKLNAIAQELAHVPNEQQEDEKAFYHALIDDCEEEALSFREWSKETIKDLKIKASLKASKHKERCDELEEAVRGYISYIEKYETEIKELKEELSGYEIAENERLEVFTNEEYKVFQTRLTEWQDHEKDNQHQQELFKAKTLTLEQSEEHYKNSYYYQRGQNERFIDMHEKLLDTIQLSGKENMIKTVKDAKNTDWKK